MGKDNFKSKIYTKSGDKGSSSLIGGKRISKSSTRLAAYGTVDELNSFIGLLVIESTDNSDNIILSNIQSLLFVAGCELATEPEREPSLKIQTSDIDMLEKEIDKIDSTLPKLSGFIIPRGTKGATIAHICRTICRRAERHICKLNETETVDEPLIVFINRLSDYFFVLGRKLCLIEKEEIFWHNACK